MSQSQDDTERSERHIVIAGTGRSGTSFLVRYLTALGFDTTLARNGEAAGWDLEANAGLENIGLGYGGEALPYVIKSPWIGEYVDKLLTEKRFKIDAFIVPVRDLVEAATSRTVLELRAIHQGHPWMAECLDKSWETFAHTPGGIIYSLNPLDQARLLAVQFHHLVLQVSEASVPIVFPVFPRIATDWEYLHRCLESVLPRNVTREMAHSAHIQVADTSKIRVTGETAEKAESKATNSDQPQAGPRYPGQREVDNIALRREIVRLRQELASQAVARLGLEREREALQSVISDLNNRLSPKSATAD